MSNNNTRPPLTQLTNTLGNGSRTNGAVRKSLAPQPANNNRRQSVVPTDRRKSSFGVAGGGRPSLMPPPPITGRLSNVARQSLGAGVKRSSIFNAKGIRTDPRPLNDKTWMNQSVKKLITFLTVHSYPAQLAPKILLSPTAKDFANIFQFLYK
jgi:SMC interacting uncharacterized protein involved in chromosome segregation